MIDKDRTCVPILSSRSEAICRALIEVAWIIAETSKRSRLNRGHSFPMMQCTCPFRHFEAIRVSVLRGKLRPGQRNAKPHFLKVHHRKRFIIVVLHTNKHSNSSTQPSNKSKSLNMVKAGMSCIAIMLVKPLVPVPRPFKPNGGVARDNMSRIQTSMGQYATWMVRI